jgi:hypothetical protein
MQDGEDVQSRIPVERRGAWLLRLGRAHPGEPGGRLLLPWQGGMVFAAWAAGVSGAGTVAVTRRDIA